MCNSTTVHRPTAGFNGIVDPFSFSTFHLLRTCNRLILPTDIRNYYTLTKDANDNINQNNNNNNSNSTSSSSSKSLEIEHDRLTGLPPPPLKSPKITDANDYNNTNSIFPTVCPKGISPTNHSSVGGGVILRESCSPLGFEYPPNPPASSSEYSLSAGNGGGGGLSHQNGRLTDFNYNNLLHRRQRGEKRAIPNDQKDDKYYERRKRNNEAAKKSRDARKMREDRIAFRAALLEQENAILRAQMVAMRDEMTTLRQMMARPGQISVNI